MTALTLHATTPPSAIATAAAPAQPGMVAGSVRAWLRIEGLAAFVAGLALYAALDGNWFLLVPLLLLPDMSAIGYLGGARLGAFAYNLFHTWAIGLAVLGLGVWLAMPAIQLTAAILIAHVGMDRAVGYGLKLPASFQHTHLGRKGRGEA